MHREQNTKINLLLFEFYFLCIKTKLENLVQFFRKNNVLSKPIKEISCTNFGTKKGRKLISTWSYSPNVLSPEVSVKNTRKFWFRFKNKTKRVQNMSEKFTLKLDNEELKKWHHLSKMCAKFQIVEQCEEHASETLLK